jgi:hypothetical protein
MTSEKNLKFQWYPTHESLIEHEDTSLWCAGNIVIAKSMAIVSKKPTGVRHHYKNTKVKDWKMFSMITVDDYITLLKNTQTPTYCEVLMLTNKHQNCKIFFDIDISLDKDEDGSSILLKLGLYDDIGSIGKMLFLLYNEFINYAVDFMKLNFDGINSSTHFNSENIIVLESCGVSKLSFHVIFKTLFIKDSNSLNTFTEDFKVYMSTKKVNNSDFWCKYLDSGPFGSLRTIYSVKNIYDHRRLHRVFHRGEIDEFELFKDNGSSEKMDNLNSKLMCYKSGNTDASHNYECPSSENIKDTLLTYVDDHKNASLYQYIGKKDEKIHFNTCTSVSKRQKTGDSDNNRVNVKMIKFETEDLVDSINGTPSVKNVVLRCMLKLCPNDSDYLKTIPFNVPEKFKRSKVSKNGSVVKYMYEINNGSKFMYCPWKSINTNGSIKYHETSETKSTVTLNIDTVDGYSVCFLSLKCYNSECVKLQELYASDKIYPFHMRNNFFNKNFI